MKKSLTILVFLLALNPTLKAQVYYSGKIISESTAYVSIKKNKRPKRNKEKIFIRQIIDSAFIQVDIIIKAGKKTKRHSKRYERFVEGKHYSDFRLFVRKRADHNFRYIRSDEQRDIGLFDGIFRSLLPGYEFFHEKTHNTYFQSQLENRYRLSFDIIKQEYEYQFSHKLYFSKSVEMTSYYYTADGTINTKNQAEDIKIQTIGWRGSSARPFEKSIALIQLKHIKKKRKLRRLKSLFKKNS